MSSVNQKRSTIPDESVDKSKRLRKNEDKNEASTFDFKEKTWKDDLTLIVEKNRLFVTKAVLAHASPVFDRMFQSSFKEKWKTELELPGKKITDVIQFLRCIYPGTADVCPGNVLSIVPLAEEYQVSYLKTRCEACLLGMISKPISNDKLYTILGLARMYSMPDVLEKCIDLASNLEVDVILNAEKEFTIPPALKAKILERTVIKLQSKKSLEVLKNYYECFIGQEKLNIGDYSRCDGRSFRLSVSSNQKKSLTFQLQGILIEFTVLINASNTHFNNVSITFTTLGIDDEHRGQIVGTFVIKPSVKGKEAITKPFRFNFSGNSFKELSWTDIVPVKSKQGNVYGQRSMFTQGNLPTHNMVNGYLYHVAFEIELQVLLEKTTNNLRNEEET